MTEPGRIRGRVFIAILLSALAFAFVFWNLIPPTYLTNDDVAIKRDLEGFMAPDGTPTGYAVWPHALLGWMLVWGQRVIAVHGWDFVVAGLLVWSVALVLAAAWSLSVGRADRFLAILATLLVVVPLFEGMQYTISATLAGGAAMLAMMMELFVPAPRRSMLFASAALLAADHTDLLRSRISHHRAITFLLVFNVSSAPRQPSGGVTITHNHALNDK